MKPRMPAKVRNFKWKWKDPTKKKLRKIKEQEPPFPPDVVPTGCPDWDDEPEEDEEEDEDE